MTFVPSKNLGHQDVATTMIYTHVLNRPGVTVRSRDRLIDEKHSRNRFQG